MLHNEISALVVASAAIAVFFALAVFFGRTTAKEFGGFWNPVPLVITLTFCVGGVFVAAAIIAAAFIVTPTTTAALHFLAADYTDRCSAEGTINEGNYLCSTTISADGERYVIVRIPEEIMDHKVFKAENLDPVIFFGEASIKVGNRNVAWMFQSPGSRSTIVNLGRILGNKS